MRRYRIVKSVKVPGHFEVQHRHHWWPFWLYTDTAPTQGQAREIAHGHAQDARLVEDMGWLPLPAEENETHD